MDEYMTAFNGDNADVFKVFTDEEMSSSYQRAIVKVAAELLDQVGFRPLTQIYHIFCEQKQFYSGLV